MRPVHLDATGRKSTGNGLLYDVLVEAAEVPACQAIAVIVGHSGRPSARGVPTRLDRQEELPTAGLAPRATYSR